MYLPSPIFSPSSGGSMKVNNVSMEMRAHGMMRQVSNVSMEMRAHGMMRLKP